MIRAPLLALIGLLAAAAASPAATAAPKRPDGPAWAPGRHGLGARFEGRGDALDCGRDPSLATPGGLTVAFWLRLDAHRPGAPILRKPYAFEVVQGPADQRGSLELNVWPQGRACRLPPEESVRVAVPLRTWHHVTLTYDSRGARLGAWLDGRQVAGGSLAAACPERTSFRLAPTRYPLVMGGGPAGFKGTLDDVVLAARVLRPTEIVALAAPGACSALTREGAGAACGENGPSAQPGENTTDRLLGCLPGGGPPDPQTEPDSAMGCGLLDAPRLERQAGAWSFDDAHDPVADGSGNGNTCRGRGAPSFEALPRLGGPVDAPILAADGLVTAWLASANERVFQADRPRPAKPSTPIAVSVARNEVEAFQLVLRPRRSLHGVRVAVSDLSLGDHRWPADAITVRRVARVPVDRPSVVGESYRLPPGDAVLFEQQARAGWHPDPLVDGPFDAPAGDAVALWVSARAPAGLPAGLYRGTLTLTSTGRAALAIPFTVRVWGFTLPDRLRANAVAAFDLNFGEGLDVEAIARDFAAHHVALATLPPPAVTFDGTRAVLDTDAFDRIAALALDDLGMRDVFFPLTGPYFLPRARDCADRKWMRQAICSAPGELSPDFLAALSSYVGQMAAHLAARGWLARFRFSVLDEPGAPADKALVRQIAALVRRVAPGLPIAETHGPVPDLEGSVDQWLLGPFQPARMAAALARGERLDWYPNNLPLIDRPATNTRILGWVMWRHRLSGLFLWATQVGWRALDRDLAWQRPARTTRDGSPLWGAGTFFYPDDDWRPLPSVRWELVRDTLEDYEYLALLDDLCRAFTTPPPAQDRSEGSSAEADAALVREACAWLAEVPARMVPAMESEEEAPRWRRLVWETDPAALTRARDRLGSYLEQLTMVHARTKNAPNPPADASPPTRPTPGR